MDVDEREEEAIPPYSRMGSTMSQQSDLEGNTVIISSVEKVAPLILSMAHSKDSNIRSSVCTLLMDLIEQSVLDLVRVFPTILSLLFDVDFQNGKVAGETLKKVQSMHPSTFIRRRTLGIFSTFLLFRETFEADFLEDKLYGTPLGTHPIKTSFSRYFGEACNKLFKLFLAIPGEKRKKTIQKFSDELLRWFNFETCWRKVGNSWPKCIQFISFLCHFLESMSFEANDGVCVYKILKTLWDIVTSECTNVQMALQNGDSLEGHGKAVILLIFIEFHGHLKSIYGINEFMMKNYVESLTMSIGGRGALEKDEENEGGEGGGSQDASENIQPKKRGRGRGKNMKWPVRRKPEITTRLSFAKLFKSKHLTKALEKDPKSVFPSIHETVEYLFHFPSAFENCMGGFGRSCNRR